MSFIAPNAGSRINPLLGKEARAHNIPLRIARLGGFINEFIKLPKIVDALTLTLYLLRIAGVRR